MAETLETSFNFGIENTMETGNTQVLEGLFAPETVSTAPDDVKIIEKDKEKKPAKVEAPKKEEVKETPKDNSFDEFLLEEGKKEGEDKDVSDKPLNEKEGEEPPVKDENIYTSLSKDLFKIGFFSKDEEEGDVEITTPEELLERMNLEKKKGAIEVVDRFIGQFGEDYQNAFQAIYVKGVDPKEYFGAYNNITDFAALDLKIEANQVAIIKQALFDQGFEPEDITTEVERIKNYGDLESVAEKHHKVLVKKETAKIAKLEQDGETKLQQQASIKNQYIKNVQSVLQDKVKNKEFDGIPISPKLATELQDFLITERYKTPSGETLTEFDRTILDLKRPENHERKVKVALLLKILETDPTLSTIQKAGITKKTDVLFGELARQREKSPIRTEKTDKKPSSWFTN